MTLQHLHWSYWSYVCAHCCVVHSAALAAVEDDVEELLHYWYIVVNMSIVAAGYNFVEVSVVESNSPAADNLMSEQNNTDDVDVDIVDIDSVCFQHIVDVVADYNMLADVLTSHCFELEPILEEDTKIPHHSYLDIAPCYLNIVVAAAAAVVPHSCWPLLMLVNVVDQYFE